MNRLVTSIRPALGRSISSATLGARPAARRAPQMALVPSRGLNDTAYQTFFKINVRYVTVIVAGAVALEVVYGSATDMLWESMNRGVSLKAALQMRHHMPLPHLSSAHRHYRCALVGALSAYSNPLLCACTSIALFFTRAETFPPC